MAEISVIIPVYNAGQYIEKCLDALCRQTFSDIEILCIDDGSSDDTWQHIAKHAAEDKRIRAWRQQNAGPAATRNRGLQNASAPYIMFCDADDWYEPDAVETVLTEFGKGGCDLLFSDIRLHRADGSCFVKKARLRRFQTSRDWNHPTMFVEAGVYKGHPFRNRGIHDDYGCYLQMGREGYRVRTLGKVLANFRMGGVSNRKSLREALGRIRDRYVWCYRANGYSRWYLVECIAIECVKMVFG